MSNATFRFAYLHEPPFCFTAADGLVGGCDVELARHVVGELGLGWFEPVEARFAELLPGLADRRWQMTTGLFITPARRRTVRFSRPIWALHDGLMVAAGNPKGLNGYRSLAADPSARLAVIAGQVQHETALASGVPSVRIAVFDTQEEAAQAVARGEVDAYASVAVAHRGYIDRQRSRTLDVVDVSVGEKEPAFGAFAFAIGADAIRQAVDAALEGFLGSSAHRQCMLRYGFGTTEVDRVAG